MDVLGQAPPAPKLPEPGVQQETREDSSSDRFKQALFQQFLNQNRMSLTQQILNQELSSLMPMQGLLG